MEGRSLVFMCMFCSVTALIACGKPDPKTDATPAAVTPTADKANSAPAAGVSESGIAIYPGAETMMSGHRIGGDKNGDMIDSAFKSADKPEKVAAFYRDELAKVMGDKTKVAENSVGEGIVHLQAGDGVSKYFDIMIRPEGADTIFTIKSMVKAK